GYALVFPWFEGYPLGPLPEHMQALRALPLITRLALYDRLAEFLTLASAHDCVAAGLWDNDLLLKASSPQALFCSVDHYLRMPARAPYGKQPGSPWYVPPEGYEPGAPLSEAANVYAMGALAFTFFGDRETRSLKTWEAGPGLHRAAMTAVSDKPSRRYPDAAACLAAWRAEVMRLDVQAPKDS
ncbi:MAG TPA: hypothetical protein VLA21_00100, partial [Candidatus Limnocylindria bacterium]|nr:hypothetical protein [Candidatus Limnocylindria bacterium]